MSFSYEPKWTKGNWQVEGARHSGDLKIGPGTRLHMVGPDGDAVAAVFFDMKTGRGLPDAHLMSAAPDLADALIPLIVIALDALDTMDLETRAEAESDIFKARAALNKAMGKS